MANRYWVGGFGIWNATNTANWSDTSGGVGGASAPTSSDDVFLDVNSGTSTVSYQNGAVCANFNCTGYTGTLQSLGQVSIYGNVTVSAGMVIVIGQGMILSGTGSYTITSNGNYLDNIIINTTGSYAQADALNTDSVEVIKGTFSTNNYTLNAAVICSSTDSATINFGSSTVSGDISFQTGASLTFNAGTSTLTSYSVNTGTYARTFYNWSRAGSQILLNGDATFNNVTLSASSTSATFGGNMTINGTLSMPTGTSVSSSIRWQSTVTGVQRTINVNTISGTPTYYFFSDIKFSGSVVPLTSSYFGDLGNNSGITFPAPVTYYWVGGTGTWGSSTRWATSSGGTAVASVFPLPQDSVVFDDNSGGAGMVVTAQSGSSGVYITSFTATSRTLTMSYSMSSGNRALYLLGDFVVSSACSLTATLSLGSASLFISFNGRTLQNLNLSGNTSQIPFQFFNSSGGVKLLSNLTINRGSGLNLTAPLNHLSGTIDTNGYSITLTGRSGYLAQGSDAKALILGSTTLSTTAWQVFSGAFLTISGNATIRIETGFSPRFYGGQFIYYPTVDCNASTVNFDGSSTFANITNSYKTVGASTITFTANTINKFDAFNLAGEATRVCALTSTLTPSNRATLVMSDGSPINAGSTSTDGGSNSGVLFTGTGAAGYLNVSYINSLVTNGFLLLV